MKTMLWLAAAVMSASTPLSAVTLQESIRADMPMLLELYRDLHAHPELSMDEVRTRCYLRLAVDDVPGVFAQVTGVLADHAIGLASVIQREPGKGPADVVLLTYAADESALAQAESELARLPCTRAVRARIRVEEART